MLYSNLNSSYPINTTGYYMFSIGLYLKDTSNEFSTYLSRKKYVELRIFIQQKPSY